MFIGKKHKFTVLVIQYYTYMYAYRIENFLSQFDYSRPIWTFSVKQWSVTTIRKLFQILELIL